MTPPRRETKALAPTAGELGLAAQGTRDLALQTADAWSDFLHVAKSVDLDGPTRRKNVRARRVVAKVGDWPESHQLADILADAAAGNLTDIDQDSVDERVIAAHEGDSSADILAGIERARDSVVQWAGDLSDSLALKPVGSPLGPLPVVTYAHAAAFQLAIAARDIIPGNAPIPPRLAIAGLRALVDTTGAIAARMGIDAGLAVVTDIGSVYTRSIASGWTAGNIHADGGREIPGIEGEVGVVLDVAAGRQSPFNRFGKPKITIRDVSHLLVLAPITQDVPGLPGGVVLRKAAAVLSTVNLGRGNRP